MYRAKEKGGNKYQFYTADMNALTTDLLELENSLRKAVERNELEVYYQPKLDLRTNQIVGMEALLRWKSPQFGFVSPVKFIPLAEETGLIVPIGEWVLRMACKQNKDWMDRGFAPMIVAVNLSARQFEADLVSVVARVLEETGLDPQYLELEITESITMNNQHRVVEKLHALKQLGVKIGMDDFGTGYSSLSYLKKFPIDTLKIDKSFVRDITSDMDDAAIVEAVIAMGHSLKLNVVAEGVENVEQLDFLRSRDCDEIQGFWFSAPLPLEQFEVFLDQRRQLI
jgi:EAL domain-containing protein (putative c-di-GMP-specific phosphodiesterase class I)